MRQVRVLVVQALESEFKSQATTQKVKCGHMTL